MCENGQELKAHKSNGLSIVQTEDRLVKAYSPPSALSQCKVTACMILLHLMTDMMCLGLPLSHLCISRSHTAPKARSAVVAWTMTAPCGGISLLKNNSKLDILTNSLIPRSTANMKFTQLTTTLLPKSLNFWVSTY